MTSIEKTAYPRFSNRQSFNQYWLTENFTLSDEEKKFIKRNAHTPTLKLCLAMQLKTFKHLGYFTETIDIPGVVIKTIRRGLGIKGRLRPTYSHPTTKYRHRDIVRTYLKIQRWDFKNKNLRRSVIGVATKVSETMNYPADIINVVIEYMVKNNFELPAFRTIDRLVRHIRSMVNNRIFSQIYDRAKAIELCKSIDTLLTASLNKHHTEFNQLKKLPKSPSVQNFKSLLIHHDWLMSLGDISKIFDGIAKIKVAQFASQAAALDAAELKTFSPKSKYSLVTALIHDSQQRIKDGLASMFCKVIFTMHKGARRELEELREKHSSNAHDIAVFLRGLTVNVAELKNEPDVLAKIIIQQYESQGGTTAVIEECEKVAAYNSKNHLPLLWRYYKSHRSTLFKLLESLALGSTTQNARLMDAIEILRSNESKKSEQILLQNDIDLSFCSEDWRKLIFQEPKQQKIIYRKYFEVCIFSYIANELRAGDLYVEGADSYADYRTNLLSWEECLPLLNQFCEEVGLPHTTGSFVAELKSKFINQAATVDKMYPDMSTLVLDDNGIPTLKKTISTRPENHPFVQAVKERMPERNLLDILCNTHQHVGWAHCFGPLSGSEPKIQNSIERYIINTFGNGTALGPAQTARHMKTDITAGMLSRINNKHVDIPSLQKASNRIINYYGKFAIAKILGDEKRCGADGTLQEIYDTNLLAESHFRYKHRGGIAYHHVSDTYIALFSTFIPCGVWEAVEIIEGLLKNKSDIRPDTIHADTQGQSAPVFGLAYLFNIKLMPRIRNFKDMTFFRPDNTIKYKHIDALFDEEIDWQLIETHWQDLMQVALSIKYGKVSSSVLLRKLSNYSRQNRLYCAFRELGRVIRTMFLLKFISEPKLRENITATTNKVEAYNGLSDWTLFGSKFIVASNDAKDMEKAIKYNMIVTNSIILQNLIDISEIIFQMKNEGYKILREEIALLSPYLTEHIKRFGDYIIDLTPIAAIPDQIRDIAV